MKRRKRRLKKYKLNIKDNNINNKINVICSVLLVSFLVIFIRILYINIYMGNHYKILLKNANTNIIYGESTPRGNIYDCNKKLLVGNVAIKSIYYKNKNNISTKEELEIAKIVSKKINIDYKNVSTNILKKYFYLTNEEYVNSKITDKEKEDLKLRKITIEEIEDLKLERISKNDLNKLTKDDRCCAYLYYLMTNGYYYDEKDIIINASDNDYAYILENQDEAKGFYTKITWDRVYPYGNTLRGVLGRVSNAKEGLPEEDSKYYLSLGYSLDDRVGVSGLEKYYEDILHGKKDKYVVNEDNTLTLIEKGSKGSDIILSIDIDVQIAIDKMLEEEIRKTKNEANTEFYKGSYVVIENPTTGDIIAMCGKQILDKTNEIYDYSEGAILSTVTPGSVVKGASILVGYNTKVIDIGTKFYDRCIKLYNLPSKCSWTTLGLINDAEAIKHSSNVYQYMIAMRVGGFQYGYNKKLVIDEDAFDTYRNIFYQFGLGSSTGIDYPKEELGYKGTSRAGDLLINFAIGQYDTYTPLQLVNYISTIANDGVRLKTKFLKAIIKDGEIIDNDPVILNMVDADSKYIKRIQYGMKLVMKNGTGQFGYMGSLGYKGLTAGKTGTSESFVDVDGDGVIDYPTISNNFVGYAPNDKPIMSIATSSPDVQNPNRGSYKTTVNTRISGKATDIFFKYYDLKGVRKK